MELLGQDLGSAMFTGAWQGALTGFVFGGVTGFANAKANGLNPWTGKAQTSPIPHKPLMTGPDAMPSHPNAASYEGNVTKISPNMKGKMGVQRAMSEIVDEGGNILGTEVTIEVDGIRIRPDIIYRRGRWHARTFQGS